MNYAVEYETTPTLAILMELKVLETVPKIAVVMDVNSSDRFRKWQCMSRVAMRVGGGINRRLDGPWRRRQLVAAMYVASGNNERRRWC